VLQAGLRRLAHAGIFAAVRVIDVHHLGRERVIGTWEHEGVLVDPGPESTIATLLEGLGDGFEPRAILLTHIHFDHAGASGRLVERFPDVPVYVHEIGLPHMADPRRLVKSATRLYGEEGMRELWGEVVAVPEDNLNVLRGGETILGDYRVEYTPGHASHHVSYLHEPTGTALVGDVAGVRIPPSELVLAPTPPPDIDVEAWYRSVDLVEGWQPERLALTHFGDVTEDIPGHLQRLRDSLEEEAAVVGATTEEEFVRRHVAMLEERHDAETARVYAQALPPHHIWLGLDRWRSKQEAR
jgi:glyoxylase-like metal-dependent hydrolase (beta-lactamase superfamily II)